MVRRLVMVAGALSLVGCASHATDDSADTESRLNGGSVPVTVIDNQRVDERTHPNAALIAVVRSTLDLTGYREARVEDVPSSDGTDHLVVQLLVEGKHSMKLARIDVDGALGVRSVTHDYVRSAEEEFPSTAHGAYACPDDTVQFISFCPNDYAIVVSIDITRNRRSCARRQRKTSNWAESSPES